MDHILSIVLFTPLVGLLVLMFLPSSNARAIKLWANAVAFVGFLVSLPLVFNFDHTKDYQFEEKGAVDSLAGRHVPYRHRRVGPAAGDADHRYRRAGDSFELERHSNTG